MSVKLEDLVRGRQRLGLDAAPAPMPPQPKPPPPPEPPTEWEVMANLLRVTSTAQPLLRAFLGCWIVVGVVSYAFFVGAWRALTWPWRRREAAVITVDTNTAGGAQ